ncbi:Transposase, Mutator family [Pseudonocardia oroxyli]|uniref:Mutator family transposase n=1 Tax=Pseudonocardia oroxyli TaxID=366584 RepID=A0A1G8EV65_PSEOR|nr:Transposase, Mutator family [Pseudonocardia oroxyli]
MERFLEFCETWGDRYPAIVRLWENAWAEFVPFLSFDVEIRKIVCTTNAIESVNARIRRAVKTRGHFPNEAAALKCVYMAIMSLDPTGAGQRRWSMRWKPALNAFDNAFGERLSAARRQTSTDLSHTGKLTVPLAALDVRDLQLLRCWRAKLRPTRSRAKAASCTPGGACGRGARPGRRAAEQLDSAVVDKGSVARRSGVDMICAVGAEQCDVDGLNSLSEPRVTHHPRRYRPRASVVVAGLGHYEDPAREQDSKPLRGHHRDGLEPPLGVTT